ncbi:uncharacterized protein LOC134102726 [Sardina pilchardus]|uniref:uncharacterized protein LOC134102726 n=1 Tax=Sardina pilchardus TaxID=27697 RepID=UPI002E108F55
MKENTCSFNKDQELHSTLSLIECGVADCGGDIDENGPGLNFGAWSNCYSFFPTTDKQFLKITIDQRKGGAETRKTVNYYNTPVGFIDRCKLGRARCVKRCQRQGQEVDRHPDCNLTSSPKCTGQKCQHESASGDNKEKFIPENKKKWSSDENSRKPCSVEDLEGPICITCCVKSYQNSGDISPPDPSHQTSRMKKHGLFQSPSKANSVSWNQAFGRRAVKKKATSSDAMKDISLSTHKNNIVWCRKCPDPPSGQCRSKFRTPGGPGREEMKKAISMFTQKGRGSGSQRMEQLHMPVVVSPFVKRSQTPIFWHGHQRSQPLKFGDKYTTLPRSAPPHTLLIESSRRMYSNKAIEKPWM